MRVVALSQRAAWGLIAKVLVPRIHSNFVGGVGFPLRADLNGQYSMAYWTRGQVAGATGRSWPRAA